MNLQGKMLENRYEILEKIGFSAEYHLDEKKHIVVIAKKL